MTPSSGCSSYYNPSHSRYSKTIETHKIMHHNLGIIPSRSRKSMYPIKPLKKIYVGFLFCSSFLTGTLLAMITHSGAWTPLSRGHMLTRALRISARRGVQQKPTELLISKARLLETDGNSPNFPILLFCFYWRVLL